MNALTSVFAVSVNRECLTEFMLLKHAETTDNGHVSGHIQLAIYVTPRFDRVHLT